MMCKSVRVNKQLPHPTPTFNGKQICISIADEWSQKFQVEKYDLKSPTLHKNVCCGIEYLELCNFLFSSVELWVTSERKAERVRIVIASVSEGTLIFRGG